MFTKSFKIKAAIMVIGAAIIASAIIPQSAHAFGIKVSCTDGRCKVKFH